MITEYINCALSSSNATDRVSFVAAISHLMSLMADFSRIAAILLID
jgi:hypothetical protein